MDFLVLKKPENRPWEITQLVRGVTAPTTLDEARDIAQQGYTGEGRYRLVRWDNGRNIDLKPAPPLAADPPPDEEPAP
jgi:hypothetical protein